MPEREPKTQEVVNLHERGGLTPAHWEEVVQRISKPKDEIAAKIVAYAQKVISGEFPDSDFHHRRFLGQRHWRIFSYIGTENKVVIHRKIASIDIPFLIKSSNIVNNPLAEEIKKYASYEKDISYTLDDHFMGVLNGFIPDLVLISKDSHSLKWFEQDKTWFYYARSFGRLVGYDSMGQIGPITNANDLIAGFHEVIESKRDADANVLLYHCLSTKEELKDPLHTDPKDLMVILRNAVSVDVLNERLNSFLGKKREKFQIVGGWEKEI